MVNMFKKEGTILILPPYCKWKSTEKEDFSNRT
jgi:hypothetical protein